LSDRIERDRWGTRIGFIMAAAGSAIGLGNIWRFPYMVGSGGGSAFVVVYILCVALIGLPMIIAELVIGRSAQRDPVGAYLFLRPGTPWVVVGVVAVITSFIILSYYSVVAGWSLAYIVKSVTGSIGKLTDQESAKTAFESFVANPFQVVTYHALFLVFCVLIVIKGIKSGIEKWSEILMPIFFLLILVIIVRSVTLPGSREGLYFFLHPDFSKIDSNIVLMALGQACFTLSIGMGCMITYGSYLKEDSNLPLAAAEIAGLDTLIAFLAGIAIFPAVFAMGLQPDQGPGLTFHVLPAVFARMPGGVVFATLFFFLLSIAALTSGISLLEVITAYAVDEWNWPRRRAVIIAGVTIFLLGIPAALSFGPLSRYSWAGRSIFGWMDYVTSDFLLPAGILFVALFVGWSWRSGRSIDKMPESMGHPWILASWSFIVRWISPVAIGVIFLYKFLG